MHICLRRRGKVKASAEVTRYLFGLILDIMVERKNWLARVLEVSCSDAFEPDRMQKNAVKRLVKVPKKKKKKKEFNKEASRLASPDLLGDDCTRVVVGEDVLRTDGHKVAAPDDLVRRQVDSISLDDLLDHVLWLDSSSGCQHSPETYAAVLEMGCPG